MLKQILIHTFLKSLFLILISLATLAHAKDFSSSVIQRPSKLTAKNVGVVYNVDDPKSVEVAKYYIKARNIPEQNLIKVKLPVEGKGTINGKSFNTLKQSIDNQLNPNMQVLLLVWTTPYAVECGSITSALTFGKLYNKSCSCDIKKSKDFKRNPYFNSRSLSPLKDHNMRLTMLLPTESVKLAKAVIDRGILSEFSLTPATGYFVKTESIANSKPRERFFPKDFSSINVKKLKLRAPKTNYIKHKKDIMFYFTGHSTLRFLDTLTFLPGAVADHLTSFGGILDNAKTQVSNQMVATAWLEAGATGSYGSVTEPCNYWQKFPNPQVLLSHYLAGETLVESYWKSVKWPTQGLFIGEPLAAPYKQYDRTYRLKQ